MGRCPRRSVGPWASVLCMIGRETLRYAGYEVKTAAVTRARGVRSLRVFPCLGHQVKVKKAVGRAFEHSTVCAVGGKPSEVGMAAEWYYTTNKQQMGPVSWDELRQ